MLDDVRDWQSTTMLTPLLLNQPCYDMITARVPVNGPQLISKDIQMLTNVSVGLLDHKSDIKVIFE